MRCYTKVLWIWTARKLDVPFCCYMWWVVCFLCQCANSRVSETALCYVQYNFVRLCFSDSAIFFSVDTMYFNEQWIYIKLCFKVKKTAAAEIHCMVQDGFGDNAISQSNFFCGTYSLRMEEYLSMTISVLDDCWQAEPRSTAVSYTHLDVYKRQP